MALKSVTIAQPEIVGSAGASVPASVETVFTSGFGDTGPVGPPGPRSVLTPTATKTTNYTLGANELVPADSSGSAFTLTLPTAPADTTQEGVKLIVNGHDVTVQCGGTDTFATGGTTRVLKAVGQAVYVQYEAGIWYVIAVDDALGQPLGAAIIGSDGNLGGTGGTPLPPLSSVPVPTASVSLNNQKLTLVADATGAQDALNQRTGDARYDATGSAAAAQTAAEAASVPSGGAGTVASLHVTGPGTALTVDHNSTLIGLVTAQAGITLDAGSGTAGQTLTLTGRNAGAAVNSTVAVDNAGALTLLSGTGSLVASTSGGTAFTATTTTFNLPTGSQYQVNGAQIALSNLSNATTGTGTTVVLSASPALTGTPTAPTPATADNSTTVATTAFVQAVAAGIAAGAGLVSSVFGRTGAVVAATNDYTVAQVTGAAPLASPTFTGVPEAPTATAGTNTTQLATTAFVTTAVAGVTVPVTSVFGRTGAVVAASNDYSVGQVTGAAPLASPTFTGVPAGPTAAVDTNTTQLASTAFVLGQASAAGDGNPAMDGAAARGTSPHFARADHVHPVDTSRAGLAGSNNFTGANTFSSAGTALAVTNNATVGGTLGVTGLITATGGVSAPAMGTIAYLGAQVAGNFLLANFLLAADANPAFRISGGGVMVWGPGGATAVDTNLYRNGVGLLRTDGALSVGGTSTFVGLQTLQANMTMDAGSGTATQTLTLTGRSGGTAASASIAVSTTGSLTYTVPSTKSHFFVVNAAIAATVSSAAFSIATGSQYQINGVQISTANLSDGVTGTGTIVLSASPALTGTPTVPTAAAGTNTTQAASTAFVTTAVAGKLMNYARFTSSGSWAIPTGVTQARVRITGGGGGGAGGNINTSTVAGGGGGGGAGEVVDSVIAFSGDASLTITIGAAGTGGGGKATGSTGVGANGTNGGTTTVVGATTTTTYASASGGGLGFAGVSAAAGGNGGSASGVVGGQAGTPAGAGSLGAGGGGSGSSAGGTSGASFATENVVGGGGGGSSSQATHGGSGGGAATAGSPIDAAAGVTNAQSTAPGGNGATATLPGCGGGGGGGCFATASVAGNGGNGGSGLVEIWW